MVDSSFCFAPRINSHWSWGSVYDDDDAEGDGVGSKKPVQVIELDIIIVDNKRGIDPMYKGVSFLTIVKS